MKTKRFISILLTAMFILTLVPQAVIAEEETKYLPDDDYSFLILDILGENGENLADGIFLNEYEFTDPSVTHGTSRNIYGATKVTFRVICKSNVDFKIEQDTAFDDTLNPVFDNIDSITSYSTSKEYTLVEGNSNDENRFLYQVTKDGVTYHGTITFYVYPAEYYDISIVFNTLDEEYYIYDYKEIYDYQSTENDISFNMDTLAKYKTESGEFASPNWSYFRMLFNRFTTDEENSVRINGYDYGEQNIIVEGDNYYTIEFENNGEKKSLNLIIKNSETTPWTNPFTDVETSDPFYNSVKYCNMENLILGTSDTTFSPDNVATRAMVVTLLYRIAENPDVENKTTFTDISQDDWYYNAVLWANSNGIVTGYDSEHFGPNDNITREQFATILYRYIKMIKPNVEYYSMDSYGEYVKKQYKEYTANEGNPISDYAFEPMVLALSNGIIKTKNYRIEPKNPMTRGDLAIGMAALNILIIPQLDYSTNIIY